MTARPSATHHGPATAALLEVPAHRVAAAAVRPLREADRPAVERLVEQARPGDTWDAPAAALAARAPAPELELVALDPEDPDRVVGAGLASRPAAPARAHLGSVVLVVDPAHRRRGIGRQLGEQLIDWHRVQGATGVHVDVAAHDLATLRLWDSLGMRTVGRVPAGLRSVDGSLDDVVLLHLDLRGAATPASPLDDTLVERERLLHVAARSFRERGYTGTSWEDLAAELELDRDRVVRLAGSKAELLWASATRAVMPPYTSLEQAVRSLQLDGMVSVDERLDALIGLLCRLNEALGPFVPALNEGAALDPAALAMRQGSDLRRLSLSRAIVGWLQRGERPEPEAADMVHVLMMSETYLTFVRNGWSTGRYGHWLRETLDRSVNGARAGG